MGKTIFMEASQTRVAATLLIVVDLVCTAQEADIVDMLHCKVCESSVFDLPPAQHSPLNKWPACYRETLSKHNFATVFAFSLCCSGVALHPSKNSPVAMSEARRRRPSRYGRAKN